ncbi:MAG TPA: hypothetical protein VEJ45_12450 [Candidatus Acidoferrales bacterium]|nr:hypothetical protein [Candidatus Acidoferrales bacterium]
MKTSGATIFLLSLTMLSVVGCGVAGPCAGYGCPALAPMVVAAPQQPAQTAQSHKDSTHVVEAQNERAIRSTAPTGQ